MKRGYCVTFLYKGKPHFKAMHSSRELTKEELQSLESEARIGMPRNAKFKIIKHRNYGRA